MEPPNKGHIGTRFFLFKKSPSTFRGIAGIQNKHLGSQTVCPLDGVGEFYYSECPLSKVPLYMDSIIGKF